MRRHSHPFAHPVTDAAVAWHPSIHCAFVASRTVASKRPPVFTLSAVTGTCSAPKRTSSTLDTARLWASTVRGKR